ncbi:threonine ammonia-lyase [Janthinobacterium agaricidamnosum]|uniref:Pyridoxal-phosphate dependent enzyme family protein n=1 Tax=Janthinobacterium agaricidamnosum NBRC 102515 = DSM 9628 TaxID=1349767 RepID=W0V2U2_9BURK|nr:threonine/serine dehydratase [Janthinobacterium agaricidamnosum]CDG82196.1 pyridoxal-phosphate dependent enzyme family protein [Janthinobacterium agaricidamnosum NBRC 102515 = DSM 9628]
MRIPTFSDVEAAASRLRPHIARTPLLRSPALDARLGARLLIKAECLQLTGSFKLRGAFNRLLMMTDSERKAGVVAWSAGNHGQALAFAGKILGIAVTIAMPADAPRAKIAGTEQWGATVVLYDRRTESREDIGREIARKNGALIVPPFDDPDVIAGQGTAFLEALQDAGIAGEVPTMLLCCAGGGGLIAGCALVAEGLRTDMRLHPVEPVGYDDTGRSVAEGRLVSNSPAAPSICDALMTVTPGEIPFAINKRRLGRGYAVNDDEIRAAMRVALQELKIVVEPGGAAALAAALARPELVRGHTVIVMVTGGNLDLPSLASIITAGATDTVEAAR